MKKLFSLSIASILLIGQMSTTMGKHYDEHYSITAHTSYQSNTDTNDKIFVKFRMCHYSADEDNYSCKYGEIVPVGRGEVVPVPAECKPPKCSAIALQILEVKNALGNTVNVRSLSSCAIVNGRLGNADAKFTIVENQGHYSAYCRF